MSASTPVEDDNEVSDEPICGESYDHALRLIDERDGWTTCECTECGAELLSGPDGDESE